MNYRHFLVALTGFVLAGTLFSLVTQTTHAQPDSLSNPLQPPIDLLAETTGTKFLLQNATSSDVEIASDQLITAGFVLTSDKIIFRIFPDPGPATTTQLTINGLAPQRTYHIFQDDARNDFVIQTDASGSLVYTQDIAQEHLVLVQKNPTATLFIGTDTTLTSDIFDTVVVVADNITLDCAGHHIVRPVPPAGFADGLLLFSKSGVTIRNCVFEGGFNAVFVIGGGGHRFEDNTILDAVLGYTHTFTDGNQIDNGAISNVLVGVEFRFSDRNLVRNGLFDIDGRGIGVFDSRGNTILDNRIAGASEGVNIRDLDPGGRPTTGNRVFSNEIVGGNFGVLILDATENVVSGNKMSGLRPTINVGAGVGIRSSGNTVSNNSISNYLAGITLTQAGPNQIRNNLSTENTFGINIVVSSNSTITENTISRNIVGIVGSAPFIEQNAIFRNNIFGNIDINFRVEPSAIGSLELSFNGQGNFWGHREPPFFHPFGGVATPFDTNHPGVIDSFPFSAPFMMRPTLSGSITCDFGDICYKGHKGIDINLEAVLSDPIFAPAPGKIFDIRTIDRSGPGKWVGIAHDNVLGRQGSLFTNILTRYLHLDTISSTLSIGDEIRVGDIIGTLGRTGLNAATTPHLHFEIRQGELSATTTILDLPALDPKNFVNYDSSLAALTITLASPADLEIEDPDGLIVSKALNQLPNSAQYVEVKVREFPEEPDIEDYDSVVIKNTKAGDYRITVIPEATAELGDTFTLTTSFLGKTIVLAEDILIADIPDRPNIIRLSATSSVKIIPANVGVKPETINLNQRGIFSVFIQIDKGFGVTIADIDPATISIDSIKPVGVKLADDNQLLAQFWVQDFSLSQSDIDASITLTVRGELKDGARFEGSDDVRIIRRVAPGLSLLLVNLYDTLSQLLEVLRRNFPSTP